MFSSRDQIFCVLQQTKKKRRKKSIISSVVWTCRKWKSQPLWCMHHIRFTVVFKFTPHLSLTDFEANSFILVSFKSTRRRLSDQKMNFFSKIAWTKCKDKWEWSVKKNSGHFWMEMRGPAWPVGLLYIRLTLGKAWQRQFFIRGEREDLSRAFYQHRLHACESSQRELVDGKGKKGKCKIKKVESKGSCAISAMGVMTGLPHTWAVLCIPSSADPYAHTQTHTHTPHSDQRQQGFVGFLWQGELHASCTWYITPERRTKAGQTEQERKKERRRRALLFFLSLLPSAAGFLSLSGRVTKAALGRWPSSPSLLLWVCKKNTGSTSFIHHFSLSPLILLLECLQTKSVNSIKGHISLRKNGKVKSSLLVKPAT